uniref:Glycoside hydrolase, family 28 n=1 Tax=Solibacter usitatus (strain Ellin6076) TaxID=234267 RepID=Q022X9_SOLUE
MKARFVLLIALLSSAAAWAEPPGQSCNVRDFGARGDGVALDTQAINRAIEKCGIAGGGTVYLPPGTYLSGTVRLRDNITLWLDSGATLRGTRDLSQYQTAVDGQAWYLALVLASGVHHVAVAGRGIIDGNKVRNPKGEERMRGPHALLIYNVRDGSVRDVSIQDAGNYALIVRSSERLNIDGITVRGGWDGINMHDTRNATIANCRISSGDDSLAGAYWENVTVSNCILNSSANAIRAGGRNVLFNNLVIYGPGEFPAGTSQRHRLEAGFQILPHRASSPNGGENRVVAPGPIDNMMISNVTMVNVGTPIYIAYSSDASYSANNLGVGRITFQNVTARGAGLVPVYISAPPENPAEAIVLNHVRITTIGGATEDDVQGQGFSPFSILQAYGIYGRNVRSLELSDVRIDYARKDLRSAIFGENIGALELNRFRAQRDADSAPDIQLAGPGEVLIDGKPADSTNARVIDLDAVAGEPARVTATVENSGSAGFANIAMEIGSENISRRVWLAERQLAKVSFLNLRPKAGRSLVIKAGGHVKELTIANALEGPVAEPFKFVQNTPSEGRQSGTGFYLKAAGDFPLQQYGDQYGAIYRPRVLGRHGSVIVKVGNPELRSNWVGRAGLIVRNDIAKPGESKGYAILACSPAAGVSFEWDSDGNGVLDEHTNFDGYTLWPQWLKLERDGDRLSGFSSADGKQWTKIGETHLAGMAEMMDAGIFAYRDSAKFMDFKIND